MKFHDNLLAIIADMDREDRAIVMQSLRYSDGTPASFELELTAAKWEHPSLPVADILQQVVVDH